MVNFGEKAKIKKAGNLNSGRSYVITTVSIKKTLEKHVFHDVSSVLILAILHFI